MQVRFALALLVCSTVFIGCKADKDVPQPNSVVGYWQLNKLECYCPAGTPTPDQAIEFDDQGNVKLYRNGQLDMTGTYQLSTGTTSCVTNAPLLLLTIGGLSYTHPASYSFSSNQLTIDFGLCFDAPRETYTFVPRR